MVPAGPLARLRAMAVLVWHYHASLGGPCRCLRCLRRSTRPAAMRCRSFFLLSGYVLSHVYLAPRRRPHFTCNLAPRFASTTPELDLRTAFQHHPAMKALAENRFATRTPTTSEKRFPISPRSRHGKENGDGAENASGKWGGRRADRGAGREGSRNGGDPRRAYSSGCSKSWAAFWPKVTADETLFEVEMEAMHDDVNMFEVFLSRDALLINQARQRHLAALGLDLAGKRVLEVGAGVGLHTQFFEALGCSVLTTDGRP